MTEPGLLCFTANEVGVTAPQVQILSSPQYIFTLTHRHSSLQTDQEIAFMRLTGDETAYEAKIAHHTIDIGLELVEHAVDRIPTFEEIDDEFDLELMGIQDELALFSEIDYHPEDDVTYISNQAFRELVESFTTPQAPVIPDLWGNTPVTTTALEPVHTFVQGEGYAIRCPECECSGFYAIVEGTVRFQYNSLYMSFLPGTAVNAQEHIDNVLHGYDLDNLPDPLEQILGPNKWPSLNISQSDFEPFDHQPALESLQIIFCQECEYELTVPAIVNMV